MRYLSALAISLVVNILFVDILFINLPFIGKVSAQDIVVIGAKVFTGLDVETVNTGIKIRDGKIIEVDPKLDATGSLIYSAEGGYVTAGFIDSGSTLGVEEVGRGTKAEDYKYEGAEMGAAFDPSLAFNHYSSLIPSLTSEGLTHVILRPLPGLDVLAGQGTLVHLGQDSSSIYSDARAIYVYLGEKGRDVAGKSRAAALQRLIRGLEEAKLLDRKRKAFASGRMQPLTFSTADLEALIPVVRGEKRLAVYVDRAAEIERVLMALDPFELKIVLIGAREAWKVADAITSRGIPVILNVLDNLPRSFDQLGARLDHASLLFEKGIEIAFMTEDLYTETRVLSQAGGVAVAYGLPWHEALKAMTVNPARIWGVSDEIGTLEPGKEATLVIWDGDPLEVTSHVTRVMIKGKWLDLLDRQLLLRDRYSEIDDKSRPFSYR
jgi:imidazolonepropionase-like amidohydrolase